MLDYVVTMAQYNQWMNQKVYEASARLSDEERRADKGAFFKSIHATLAHLIWGDAIWMSRFLGDPAYAMEREAINKLSFTEMAAARIKMDNDILQWSKSVRQDWLASDLTWTSVLYQKTFTQPVWLLVMQLFNHETHHRGQVTTLLTQCGVDVGVTDLPMMPRLQNYGES